MTSDDSDKYAIDFSLSDAVVPKLDKWLDDLADAVPRVINDTDREAVHDLRVALRRIRSLLRVVRSVFGAYHVNRIRTDMKQVASATGALRDEEVLSETIAALDLTDGHRNALAAWLKERAERETALRAAVIRILESGGLDTPSTQLRALLRLPLMPGCDKQAQKFARKTVFKAYAQVDALRTSEIQNVSRMHDLRIAYKRLRYSVEALSPALSPELRAWGHVSVKFQKVLGDIHDQDVAIEILANASSLPASVLTPVLAALDRKRTEYGQEYLTLLGVGITASPGTESHKKRMRDRDDQFRTPEAQSEPKVHEGQSQETASNPPNTAPAKKRASVRTIPKPAPVRTPKTPAPMKAPTAKDSTRPPKGKTTQKPAAKAKHPAHTDAAIDEEQIR